MSITNSDVRAHLRKGELAVHILEDLGYTYGTGRWVAPVDVLQPIKDAMLKMAAEIAAKEIASQSTADATELKAGEQFRIKSLPPSHVLLAKPEMARRTFKARVVEDGTGSYRGRIVRFGPELDNKGFWLPLTHVTKVNPDADF